MIDWPLVLIVLAAVVVLGGLLGFAAWWYLPPVDLPGPELAERQLGAGEPHTEDDEWAARLHEINLAVSHKVWSWFQQRMVPVSEVTHYEVEVLIGQLGVPEWVPGRYRVAA